MHNGDISQLLGGVVSNFVENDLSRTDVTEPGDHSSRRSRLSTAFELCHENLTSHVNEFLTKLK